MWTIKKGWMSVAIVGMATLNFNCFAQYDFPVCADEWSSAKDHYVGEEVVSLNEVNYKASYWTNGKPGEDAAWVVDSRCGSGGLGENYQGTQRIIGYMPTWIPGYDIANDFYPGVVTHINVSFVMFKRNNQNYNSENFASIALDSLSKAQVDSVMVQTGMLQKAQNKGVTVSAALGGATDFAFLWLMTKYYDNDAKLNEIADLLENYVNELNLDGLDLDMECWWKDPSIEGTEDQGGRVRGDKWGGNDEGPHPAGIGLTRLAKKLRERMPNKLFTAAVFGTSWYGNNYDDELVEHLDWLGLMTYDFTGSWTDSPFGPHSSLYRVPDGTYERQSVDDPIYSALDALEYWMGFAPAAWNHDGGFNVPKSKLCVGVPLYGYDFSERKPNNGNGYKFVPYNHILDEFPNAATSFDPKDPSGVGGYVGEDGKQIYFNTPAGAAQKIKYTRDFGYQGVILWELTQDAPMDSNSSIVKALNDAIDRPMPATLSIEKNQTEKLRIYPNPSKGFVYLDEKYLIREISIFSLLGQELLTVKGEMIHQIDVSSLKTGIYTIEAKTKSNGSLKEKLLIK